jgi:hypothetical protein
MAQIQLFPSHKALHQLHTAITTWLLVLLLHQHSPDVAPGSCGTAPAQVESKPYKQTP